MKRISSLILLLALIAGFDAAAFAQAMVRPGESRANKHQYLSSHNSYQRDESLTQQLDVLNVWDVELDVRWRDNAFCVGGGTGFYVLHHCADPAGEGWLINYLLELGNTQRAQNGFFFLNLELADGYACLGCFEGPLFPNDYMQQLESMVVSVFGASAIYSWQDFVVDGYQWPSPQELIRRGKHVAIHCDHFDSATVFFRRADQGTSGDPTAFWNTDDENLIIPNLGDRYLIRRWPEADCSLENGADWVTAYSNGFNLPSTNCLNFHATTNKKFFQPPLPMYVIDITTPSLELGTYGLPYRGGAGLVDACNRISFYNSYPVTMNYATPTTHYHPSRIDIHLNSGIYNINSGGGTLSAPVILHAIGGSVILQNVATLRASCPADLSGDGTVGIIDLQLLLNTWGTNDAASDLNGDGTVNATDLLALLGAWGSCDPDPPASRN